MRHFIPIIVLAICCVFIGCNSSEDFTPNLFTKNNSLMQGQQDNRSPGDVNGDMAEQPAVQADPISQDNGQASDVPMDASEGGSSHEADDDIADNVEAAQNPDEASDGQDATDNAGADNVEAAQNPDEASDGQEAHDDCEPVENVGLLFAADLGRYNASLGNEGARTPWTQMIHSMDEATEFAQTYLLSDSVKDRLISLNYDEVIIAAAYLGFQPVCGHRFNLPMVCKDSPVTLEVISAPFMDEAISFPIVFVQLPLQIGDVEVVIENKEIPFEEFESYPLIYIE